MHDTARLSGDAFFRTYGDMLVMPKILDVGSMDVNGTLRPLAPRDCDYVGVDARDGLNVDVVLDDPHRLPFDSCSFDLVVSTSCLEHDPAFWLTFREMVRVTRPGGFVYVSVPAEGPYHAHPIDCWRFNGDAAQALAALVDGLVVVENFMVMPIRDVWVDNVMVFGVSPVPERGRMREAMGR